jgi:hypothetical protein
MKLDEPLLERPSGSPRKSSKALDYVAAQGDVFSLGMGIFCLSFVFFGVTLQSNSPAVYNAGYFLQAISQCFGGTVSAAFTDLDVEEYLNSTKGRWLAGGFAILYILGNAISAFIQPQPLSQFLWINCVPFFYFLLYETMPAIRLGPRPQFCDILITSLTIWLITEGIWFATTGFQLNCGLTSDLVGKDPPECTLLSPWPYFYLGVSYFPGAVSVILAYKYGEKWPRWDGDTKTTRTFIAMYAYLLASGATILAQQLIDTYVYDGATYNWNLLGYLFGPTHILSVPLALKYRPWFHGYFGRCVICKYTSPRTS